jgi:hypothetical protein
VFRSRVDAVSVDVSVRWGGKPVGGLTAKDFALLDNGVRQQIEVVDTEAVPLDVSLIIDISGSTATLVGQLTDDMRRIAELCVWESQDPAGPGVRGPRAAPGRGPVTDVRSTPPRDTLANPSYRQPRDIWTVPAGGGTPRRLNLEMHNVFFLDVSPDGQQLLFVDENAAMELWVMKNLLPAKR